MTPMGVGGSISEAPARSSLGATQHQQAVHELSDHLPGQTVMI
jgi:hypothetical protein